MIDIIEQITGLVREQGTIMLSAHNVESTGNEIKVKPGDANFVTVYDEAVQANLIEGLKSIIPDAKFFAEEKDNRDVDTSVGYCFIIDPIDGTTNFIHGLASSAISVGLMLDGKPYAGIIYNPYRDEMFSAVKGGGAYLNGKRIQASERPLEKSVFCFGSSPYNKEVLGEKSFAIAKRLFLRTADFRRTGSAAIDICSVACGRADAMFESLLSPWDYAAGITILSEAGACVSDFNGNNLPLNAPSSFVCSNGVIYNEILKIIPEED